MANYFTWAKAFNTETKTVQLNLPLISGGSEADGTAGVGMTFTPNDQLVGRLIAVNRATKIPVYIADMTAAMAVTFDTTDIYLVSERVYAGNTFFIGYIIPTKSDLGDLTTRTQKDDLAKQYMDTITAPMQGRRN